MDFMQEENLEVADATYNSLGWDEQEKEYLKELLPDGPPDIEHAIQNVKKVLKVIKDNPCELYMGTWHCGTRHCLAGWAQVLFDKKYTEIGDSPISAESIGEMFIWPVRHLFYAIYASSGWVINEVEEIIEKYEDNNE